MAYQYFTREEWGARPPKNSRLRPRGNVDHVVHHTADRNTPDYADRVESTKKPGIKWYLSIKRGTANRRIKQAIKAYEDNHAKLVEYEKRAMRAMQNYHMDVNGWADLGYHDVTFPSGHTYQGRRFDTWGAHAYNGNHMYGHSFAGNYEVEQLTNAAIVAYRQTLHNHGLDPDRGIGHYRVPGNATACPGKNIKATLRV